MKRFITADWHLGEDRFEIMQRPFKIPVEMVNTLMQNHNSVVGPDDEVHVVGDVCARQAPDFLPYVAQFNGKKILYRGNHDQVFTDEQLAPYFQEIVPEGKGKSLKVGDIHCYVNHYPSQSVNNAFNLVGHIHFAWKYQLNMFNVGVDANHFFPHNIDQSVPFAFKAICEFYDEDIWAAYHLANEDYRGIRGKKGSYFVKG